MISEISLGIKHPLLPNQSLMQRLTQSKIIGISTNFNVNPSPMVSSIGQTVLETISQTDESVNWVRTPIKSSLQGEQTRKTRTLGNENYLDNNKCNENSSVSDLSATVCSPIESARDFPKLPVALRKINSRDALGQVHILGQSSVQSLQTLNLSTENSDEQQLDKLSLTRSDLSQVDQSSSQTAPKSWSNLAELIGEDKPLSSQSLSLEDRDNPDIEGFIFTPEGFHPIYADSINKMDNVSASIEEETTTVAGISSSPREITPPVVTVVQSSPSTTSELVNESNLRMLAQEVYKLVRQRLHMERERYRH